MNMAAGRSLTLHSLDLRLWGPAIDGLLGGGAVGNFRLDREGIERGARFQRVDDSRRSAAGEYARFRALSAFGGADLAGARVGRDDVGKPFLPDHPDVRFNLSHSGNLVICAVDISPIGVDVEHIRPIENDVARSCFTPSEREWLNRPVDGWLLRFFTLWTLKESLLKGWGVGLSVDPIDVEIQQLAEMPQLWRCVSPETGGASMSLHSFSPSEGYCGAVATVDIVSIDLVHCRPGPEEAGVVPAESYSNLS